MPLKQFRVPIEFVDGRMLVSGEGDPEGVYVAPPGSIFMSNTNGIGLTYVKLMGTGNTGWELIVTAASEGSTGTSGYSGYSGYSGINGISGYSGKSGYSGISGFSGYSGISGFSGTSGFSGYSGVSGYSGKSGYSGYSGGAARNLGFTIGGGGVITTGSKGYLIVPVSGTITKATVVADQSGSIAIDIKKSTYSGFPSTTSITASAKPTLSSAQKSQDSTLTGWTTSFSAGDVFEFLVDASVTPASVTQVSVILDYTS